MVRCNERIWLLFSIAHFVPINHIEIGLKFGLYLSFAGLVNKSYPGRVFGRVFRKYFVNPYLLSAAAAQPLQPDHFWLPGHSAVFGRC